MLVAVGVDGALVCELIWHHHWAHHPLLVRRCKIAETACHHPELFCDAGIRPILAHQVVAPFAQLFDTVAP